MSNDYHILKVLFADREKGAVVGKIWKVKGKFGKTWEDLGSREDLGRFGKTWEDMGSFGKILEDMGRFRRTKITGNQIAGQY